MQGAVLRFASPTTSLRQSRSKENQVLQVRLRPRVPAADHIIGRFETALYFVKRDSLFRVIATRNRSSGVKYALDALSFAVSGLGWSGRALTAVQARPRGKARGSLGATHPITPKHSLPSDPRINHSSHIFDLAGPLKKGVSAAAILTGPPASRARLLLTFLYKPVNPRALFSVQTPGPGISTGGYIVVSTK